MRYTAFFVFHILVLCSVSFAQPTPKKIPAAVPVKADVVETDELGSVSGRTYTNSVFNFQITFPDTWLVPDRDFEAYMKSQGFDLSLKAPDNVTGPSKIQIDRALERVKILFTAYRSMPGLTDNAIVRVSVENLTLVPEVMDAVDYFDLMRSQFARMKLPADFKYSETQAEKLGQQQFAFIDTVSSAGKKRMYATVRKGHAIMFTLTFSKEEALKTFRQILAGGNFDLK